MSWGLVYSPSLLHLHAHVLTDHIYIYIRLYVPICRYMQLQCSTCWKLHWWRNSTFLLLSCFALLLARYMLVSAASRPLYFSISKQATCSEYLCKSASATLGAKSFLRLGCFRAHNVCWYMYSILQWPAFFLRRICFCPNNILCKLSTLLHIYVIITKKTLLFAAPLRHVAFHLQTEEVRLLLDSKLGM